MKTERKNDAPLGYDPMLFARNMADVALKMHAVVNAFALNQPINENASVHSDVTHIGNAFLEASTKLLSNPQKLVESQLEWWKGYAKLWCDEAEQFVGGTTSSTPIKDRRFKNPAWEQSALFDAIRKAYLHNANWLQKTLGDVEGLDPKTARKVEFYTRQLIDALSPSNFIITNPEVLQATLASSGENLVQGLNHLLKDLERGKGKLAISMTDENAFAVGKNLATTSGGVVFQNELMQLIQYTPSTKDVHATPVLMIPAWINKFYIFDLQPENSLVRYLVDKGHTVFVISWVNPDERLAQKEFADYLNEGPIAAIRYITKVTGQEAINAIGYCLGGTLLATLLAVLHETNQENRIKSATYLTTMLDFSDAGELSVFIDDEQLSTMESRMAKKGYLEGSDMAMTFNMLRANELIWSFVVSNYLLGKAPFPFDLLYWNADSTRMPAAMHSFYLRNMYQYNRLIKGDLVLGGVRINLKSIRTPSMFVSTREDHIAPWKSTYAGATYVEGETEFVLAASGHIAGVINPPARNKYSFWTNKELPKSADNWFEGAKEHQGSWWNYWEGWLAKKSTSRVPARALHKPIEAAPGSYVRVMGK